MTDGTACSGKFILLIKNIIIFFVKKRETTDFLFTYPFMKILNSVRYIKSDLEPVVPTQILRIFT